MKTLRTLSRIVVGLVFVFSGFVKGVDPMGTMYKIQDYFIALGFEWAIPFALALSIFLCAVEFVLGALLLCNLFPKLISWLVLLMMTGFTILTFFDATKNLVPDCGCFGDAIKLTNWQTFYKNVVLMIFVIFIFIERKQHKSFFLVKTQYLLVGFIAFAFITFEIYNYRHLPIIEFGQWRVGKTLIPTNTQPIQYFLTYKNNKTGEAQEYLSPNYPYNDSSWLTQWTFVSQRIVDPNSAQLQIAISDENGNDATYEIIKNSGFQLLFVAYDLKNMSLKNLKEIYELSNICANKNISFIALTSSSYEDVLTFKQQHNILLDFYYADDTSLEILIRSNPGLILTKNAKILAKWHYRDFPNFDQINKKYINKP